MARRIQYMLHFWIQKYKDSKSFCWVFQIYYMMAGIQKEVKVIFNVFFKKTFPMPKEPLLLFQVQNRHISALCKIWSVGFFWHFT